MSSLLPALHTLAQSAAFSITPLLAQVAGEAEAEERSYSLEVGLIMLCVILGLLISLKPSKRAVEFKRRQKGGE